MEGVKPGGFEACVDSYSGEEGFNSFSLLCREQDKK